MEEYERSRIETLLGHDPELRNLWSDHLALEGRIAELEQLPHPSPAEALSRRQLQKLKLVGRDEIARLLARRAPA